MSTIRSSSPGSAKRLTIRVLRAAAVGAVALGLGVSLAGCAALLPDTGSYLETVPEAIEQSDLGVTRVTASSSPDGFGRNVYVGVHLDRATVTTAEIEQVLGLIAGKLDQPGASRVEVTFWDGATSTIDSEAACEAIGSPSIRCDYNTTSIDLDDLSREFGG
ncbi:hypothetical protein ACFVTX_12550 [Agromyces sp. NPDC058136]|uniref:hypothetical protein n=1 Tax=Agromyces sp. NPDC058136 TaxID=3346354 RepID=UPI0036DD0D7F